MWPMGDPHPSFHSGYELILKFGMRTSATKFFEGADMKGMNWTERLSIVSSVASITGVSLVWMKSAVGDKNFMTALFGGVASVVGALFAIGVLLVTLQLFLLLHRRIKARWPSAVPGYWLIVGALVIWGSFWLQIAIWWLVSEAWTIRF
ncbi:hypothetical protein D3C77_351450 [compost metagenome]